MRIVGNKQTADLCGQGAAGFYQPLQEKQKRKGSNVTLTFLSGYGWIAKDIIEKI